MARVPILRIGDCLVVTVHADLDDGSAVTLRDDLAGRVAAISARGVLIDVSALDVVDSFVARMLGDVARTVSILDAETVISGLSPAVAMTLVEMGVTIPHTRTALDAQNGLRLLGIVMAPVRESVRCD